MAHDLISICANGQLAIFHMFDSAVFWASHEHRHANYLGNGLHGLVAIGGSELLSAASPHFLFGSCVFPCGVFLLC